MPACGYPHAGMLMQQKLCQRLPCRLFRLPGKKTSAGKFSVEIKCQKSYSVFIVRSIFSINRKDCRCPSPRRRVKRETGAKPVRTRHCKWGTESGIVTGREQPGRQLECDDPQVRKPACSPGICRTTRNWPGRTKLLWRKQLCSNCFPAGENFFIVGSES